MVVVIGALAMILVGVGSTIILLISGIQFLYRKKKGSTVKKSVVVVTVDVILFIFLVWFSQKQADTPRIIDSQGNEVKGSITSLEKLKLNGHEEWISIRGWDKTKPVLLFLAGGPGGSQIAAVRRNLGELEKDYVVVSWDQPGAGKSYHAVAKDELTVETYIEDGICLTQYLCERFEKEKIYLIGESCGSALGIFMLDQAPEYFAGFIGTGQVVDFVEMEQKDYQLAIDLAEEAGDWKKAEKIEENGIPPYYENITWKSAEYLNYLGDKMTTNPDIMNSGYQTMEDLLASEYGLFDKVNYLLGIINTFNTVYPQLYDIDLRERYNSLEVPIYFFEGRHDINAPTDLVETYYEGLEAPKKELIWFEHSGHSPWINESEKFVDEVKRHFK